MARPSDEQLADLLRHAAETLRERVRGHKATARGEQRYFFDHHDGKSHARPFNGPLVSELVVELEDAAFRLETGRAGS